MAEGKGRRRKFGFGAREWGPPRPQYWFSGNLTEWNPVPPPDDELAFSDGPRGADELSAINRSPSGPSEADGIDGHGPA